MRNAQRIPESIVHHNRALVKSAPSLVIRARTATPASRANVAAMFVGVSPKDHHADFSTIAPTRLYADRNLLVIEGMNSSVCIGPRTEILALAVAATVIVVSRFIASLRNILIIIVVLIRIVSKKAVGALRTKTVALLGVYL